MNIFISQKLRLAIPRDSFPYSFRVAGRSRIKRQRGKISPQGRNFYTISQYAT